MNKLIALSLVSAAALSLGACGKTENSANVADNSANEVVAADTNLTAESVPGDNVVVADNAAGMLNAVETGNAVDANTTNSN